MTKEEAIKTWKEFLDAYMDHYWRLLDDESLSSYLFIEYLYDNNYEIVDRTIDDDTIAELDKDIADSMKFDNPLSGGE